MELSTNTRVSPLSATPPRGLAGLNEPLASYLLARSYVLAGGGENFRAERAMMRVDSSSLWLDGVGQTGDHRPTRPPGPPPDQGERSPWGVWRLTRRGGREGASELEAQASRRCRQMDAERSLSACLRNLVAHSLPLAERLPAGSSLSTGPLLAACKRCAPLARRSQRSCSGVLTLATDRRILSEECDTRTDGRQ